jgi:hypothetical protein
MDVGPILLILEPQVTVQPCLVRALMLARYLRVSLEILYPAQTLRAGSPEQERRQLADEDRYLSALRDSIQAPDVAISIEATGARLGQVVLSKARRQSCALVVKTPWHRQSQHADPIDWELLQTCPAPVLLTEGRPWQPRPRFLAAVDVMSDDTTMEPGAVLGAIAELRQACGAELDVIYMQPEKAPPGAGDQPDPVSLRMQQLRQEFALDPDRLHVLPGRPADTLRQTVALREFDLLTVGAPPSRRGSLKGRPELPMAMALTGIACDLLSVPGAVRRGRARPRVEPRVHSRAAPLWNWLGAD